MISSGVAGPLGALHLPRLWLKVSLEAAGKLAAGYPGLGKGYDQMTCDALGLDAAAVVEFIKANKPTYPAFEAWVRKNGKKLTKSDIHRHTLAILGSCHDDATRKGISWSRPRRWSTVAFKSWTWTGFSTGLKPKSSVRP